MGLYEISGAIRRSYCRNDRYSICLLTTDGGFVHTREFLGAEELLNPREKRASTIKRVSYAWSRDMLLRASDTHPTITPPHDVVFFLACANHNTILLKVKSLEESPRL